jgi:hypothetical protein
MVDPDVELTAVERSDLAMTVHSKGWQVVHKLLLAVVEQFRVDLDNADHSNPKEVLGKHSLSKSAGVVVTKILTRVSNEVAVQAESKKIGEPQDSAPGLEMDEIAQMTEGLPNLLGDVTYISEDDDDLEEGR